ncbi:MAG: MarR family winged helix-turn-helix transcriptional regulator [Enterococcus devriesei]|uniref:MarR family winged helix-turn-helix transcriptional regulator n=1 Tax=Enterococcus devriesei TaxID=319970 RepID=UPI0028A63B58|nr:MarR family winged helix-turn-helix transcriptional regulator [Enterococcus devriesei]
MDKVPGRLISILYRKNQIYLNTALKPYHITSAEQPVLMFLYENPGVTQEEIAHYLQVDKALMTRTIQALVQKGFVRKEKDQVDKRCNRVFLTDEGVAIREGIKNSLLEWNKILLGDFDEEKQQAIFSILEELVDKVDEFEKNKEKDSTIDR